MNLNTKYLGLDLRNPIVVGSSTLTGTVEGVKHCADAGAGAVVLKSLFEEQILADVKKEESYSEYDCCPEAVQYMADHFRGNEINHYVSLIKDLKQAVDIPVIASINCMDMGEWVSIAKEFQNAGADALELNIAISPFDKMLEAKTVEDEMIDIFKSVKNSISIPVAVKIGDHFTSIANVVMKLVAAGADGIVLFNRFYNPDIDINALKVVAGGALSVPEENSGTLRWISLIHAQGLRTDLCASTGVHTGEDVVKMLLAGAEAVQMCSSLYHNGLERVREVLDFTENWMKEHSYESLQEFRGKVSSLENAKTLERLQYLRRNEN